MEITPDTRIRPTRVPDRHPSARRPTGGPAALGSAEGVGFSS
jgi:hypothetical protein